MFAFCPCRAQPFCLEQCCPWCSRASWARGECRPMARSNTVFGWHWNSWLWGWFQRTEGLRQSDLASHAHTLPVPPQPISCCIHKSGIQRFPALCLPCLQAVEGPVASVPAHWTVHRRTVVSHPAQLSGTWDTVLGMDGPAFRKLRPGGPTVWRCHQHAFASS